ncbi:MAG TPA: SUMF1/EgtB/PvdO family nonheme iron enzyme [Polyangiaceae bacterium]|nr:SUMF1/EgtB/PvdO family nonheme iron enzyme [Polyangiaceae bacterium]
MKRLGFGVAWACGCVVAFACSGTQRDFERTHAAGSAGTAGGGAPGASGSAGHSSAAAGRSLADGGTSAGGASIEAAGAFSANAGRTSADAGAANGGTTSSSGGESSSEAGNTSSSGGSSSAGKGGAGSGGAACVVTNPTASTSCVSGALWWIDNCGVPATLKLDCCGQGCSGNACLTPKQHASTQCYNNNQYWVDSCGARQEQKQDCCGMGCANNQCNPPNVQATKTCSNGDSYWVDSCGMQQQLATSCMGNGCLAGACLPACPSDMVPVGSSRYCIDRYEASVWSGSNCSGTQSFKSMGDFPAGFPALASSSGLSGTVQVAGSSYSLVAPSTVLYACSKTGVIPAQYISYFQAKRACENSGKRLCTIDEQQTACGSVYPYGSTYDPTACNGLDAGNGAVVATGSMTRCQGSVPGLYDMSGNVAEWTQCDAQNCWRSSGTNVSDSFTLKCSTVSGTYASSALVAEGFRCCQDR